MDPLQNRRKASAALNIFVDLFNFVWNRSYFQLFNVGPKWSHGNKKRIKIIRFFDFFNLFYLRLGNTVIRWHERPNGTATAPTVPVSHYLIGQDHEPNSWT